MKFTLMRTSLAVVLAVAFAAGVLAPVAATAQNKVGTTAAPFLTIGVGTRPQGMGGAFVAMADDAHALYWNPAGMTALQGPEILLMHSTWLADMSFEYIGVVLPLGAYGSAGVSATLLNVGEMEVTTVTQQDGAGLYFDSYDLAVGGHYAYQFYDKFSIGGTFKYVYQRVWNETATGMAFDIGTMFITPLRDIRLGMNISNFGTKMQMSGRDLLVYHDPDETRQGNNELVTAQYETNEWKLPLTLRLGLAGEVYQDDMHRATLAMDWLVPNDNTEALNFGAEYAFQESYFLRAGLRQMRPRMSEDGLLLFEEDNGGGITFGGGLKFALGAGFRFGVDYAFESYDRLGNVHKYSLNLNF